MRQRGLSTKGSSICKKILARQEHQLAEELNCKAAAEIFKFNNRKNKIWRIDLHGLHGMEAIKAL